MKDIFTFILCLATAMTFAQSRIGTITGTVTDENQKGINGTTVYLFRGKDGSLVKMAVTNESGVYEFEKITDGEYLISITATGYKRKNSEKIIITAEQPSIVLNTLQLTLAPKSLMQVTVTGKRPLIENKIDRTVVNVDAAPTNAGATAMEVLEKSPGISVDNDGNISLKGKQGVIVMIDSKPTYLSSTDLANLLKNMPASALDQIEIMTNPPAKYDASGNSGIINIKTKKSANEGLNGSLATSGTLSFYKRNNSLLTPPRSSESINLNYRKGKINLFGSATYNYNVGKNDRVVTRKLYDSSGKLDVISDQTAKFNGRNNNYTLKLGFDHFVNKKTVWGIVLSGFVFFARPTSISSQVLSKPNGSIESMLESISFDKWNFGNYSGNINFKRTFDSAGQELAVDLDYLGYIDASKSLLVTDSYDSPGGSTTGHFELKGNIPVNIDIYSIKSDYTKPIKKKNMRFDAGFKISYVQNDSKNEYERRINDSWLKDVARSNYFIYDENISAAYISINKQWKKFSGQTGLRMEHTIARGRQITKDSSFTHDYTGLFPTIYLNYQLNKLHALTFSYGRRISRPNYMDLNPWVLFIDSLTYMQGNPYLLPQYAHNFELRHSYKNSLTTIVNYTLTDDVISQLSKQNTAKRITFLIPDNVARLENIGISITAPIKFAKWWNTNLFVNVFNNHFKGVYYNSTRRQNDPIDIQYTSYLVNVTNNLSFKKGWSGEISGWYRGKGVEQLTIYEPIYFMMIGAQKNLMKDRSILRMNFRDPFSWYKSSGRTLYSDIDIKNKRTFSSRVLVVSFSYRFGKKTVAQARRKTTGTNEEESRVGQGQQ